MRLASLAMMRATVRRAPASQSPESQVQAAAPMAAWARVVREMRTVRIDAVAWMRRVSLFVSMGNSVSGVIRPVIARAVIAGAFAREEEKAIHAAERAAAPRDIVVKTCARRARQGIPVAGTRAVRVASVLLIQTIPPPELENVRMGRKARCVVKTRIARTVIASRSAPMRHL